MNQQYLDLAKEITSGMSSQHDDFYFIKPYLIKKDILIEIGKEVLHNRYVFKDYVYYKYDFLDYYKESDREGFLDKWMKIWKKEKEGIDVDRDTFSELKNIIISNITSISGEWYYSKKDNCYLPKKTCFNI